MKLIKKIIKLICSLLLVVVLLVGGFLAFAAFSTYHPKDVEKETVKGTASKQLKVNENIKIMTWNVGYGVLDQYNDFFMDGGTMVRAKDKEVVQTNIETIANKVLNNTTDIVFFQEVDLNSSRSKEVNEFELLSNTLTLENYMNSFAINYQAGYVPYPFPTTLGKVKSGIATFSKYQVNEATRYQLPIPFSWPLSMVNLKRCLLVNRLKIEGSEKELVLVNLHLEAYDDGEGKVKQTNQLKEFIASEYAKGNYVIAGGDFNQTFSNVDNSAYPTYGNNWRQPEIDSTIFENCVCLMDNNVPTCRLLDKPYFEANKDTFQYYMIDGFIITDNISLTNIETLNYGFEHSDHNPVLMQIKLV